MTSYTFMSTKELALQTIQELPDIASWEERIHFLAAIEGGREEIRLGKVIPQKKVKENLQAWVTS
jgi:predicted transcriptional regulator